MVTKSIRDVMVEFGKLFYYVLVIIYILQRLTLGLLIIGQIAAFGLLKLWQELWTNAHTSRIKAKKYMPTALKANLT